MVPARCQALIRTRQRLRCAHGSASIWSYYSRLVSAIRWLHNLNMINPAGCELCSCNHKIRWHFCFLVERKHYICASHNFITVALGKKESFVSQKMQLRKKNMCVCVCAIRELKETVMMSASSWEILLCGFCCFFFPLYTTILRPGSWETWSPSGALPGQHSFALTHAPHWESQGISSVFISNCTSHPVHQASLFGGDVSYDLGSSDSRSLQKSEPSPRGPARGTAGTQPSNALSTSPAQGPPRELWQTNAETKADVLQVPPLSLAWFPGGTELGGRKKLGG